MQIKAKIKGIIELISNVMESYTTALFISDKKEGCLNLFFFHSFCKEIDEKCAIKRGEGLIGWVFREQKNVLATNYDRNTKTLIFYKKDENIKSLIAIPLPEKMGVLFVDSKKSYRFTEEKEKIFNQFAELIYNSLKDQEEIFEKKLIEKELFLYNETEKFNKINDEVDVFIENIFNKICNYFNISNLYFVLIDELISTYFLDSKNSNFVKKKYDNNTFLYEGLMGWCIKNKKNIVKNSFVNKPYIIDNEEQVDTIDNFLGIPLFNSNDEIKGSIGLSKFKKQEWNQEYNEYWLEKEIKVIERIGEKIVNCLV